jgi:hypothetical protein
MRSTISSRAPRGTASWRARRPCSPRTCAAMRRWRPRSTPA